MRHLVNKMEVAIAIPIRPRSAAEGVALSKKAAGKNATYCELWCDRISFEDVEEIVAASPLPVIITLKGVSEKGLFTGSAVAFKKFMLDADKLDNVAYLDINYDFLYDKFISIINKPIIASYHNFICTDTYPILMDIFEKMEKLNPAIIKIASQIHRENNVINLMQMQLVKPHWRKKIIVIGMGAKGIALRVMAPLLSQALVFAAMDEKSTTAPGQMTIDQLRAEWTRMELA